jgi:uncharacterized metal-binding protein YceD (DUF177 family)
MRLEYDKIDNLLKHRGRMRISLIGLPRSGRLIDVQLPAETLSTRLTLNEESPTDFEITSVIEVKGKIVPREAGAEFNGSYSIRYRQACARCSDPKERVLEQSLQLLFRDASESPTAEEDDVGLIILEQGTIDLEHVIHEAIILALDIFWAPDLTEDEACSLCGEIYPSQVMDEDPSQNSTLFGELLKRAVTNKN